MPVQGAFRLVGTNRVSFLLELCSAEFSTILLRFCRFGGFLLGFARFVEVYRRRHGQLLIGFAPLFHGQRNRECFTIFRAGGRARGLYRCQRHNFSQLIMGSAGLSCADIGV